MQFFGNLANIDESIESTQISIRKNADINRNKLKCLTIQFSVETTRFSSPY